MITTKLIKDYAEIGFKITVANDAEKEKAFTAYNDDVYEFFVFLSMLKAINNDYFKSLKEASLESKISTLSLICVGWNCHEGACIVNEEMKKF